MFGYFPEVSVTKIRVSAPAPYQNPTVILEGFQDHKTWRPLILDRAIMVH